MLIKFYPYQTCLEQSTDCRMADAPTTVKGKEVYQVIYADREEGRFMWDKSVYLSTQPDGKPMVEYGSYQGFNLYCADTKIGSPVYFVKDAYTAWVVNKEKTISPLYNLDVVAGYDYDNPNRTMSVVLKQKYSLSSPYVGDFTGYLNNVLLIYQNTEIIKDNQFPGHLQEFLKDNYNTEVEEWKEEGANPDTFENWVKYKDNFKGGNYVIKMKHIPKQFKKVSNLFYGNEILDHSGSIFDNEELYPKDSYDAVKKDIAIKKQIKRDKYRKANPISADGIIKKIEKLKEYFKNTYKDNEYVKNFKYTDFVTKNKYEHLGIIQDGVKLITPQVAAKIQADYEKEIEAQKGQPYKDIKAKMKASMDEWFKGVTYRKYIHREYYDARAENGIGCCTLI